MHSKGNTSRKPKTIYNTKWREYIFLNSTFIFHKLPYIQQTDKKAVLVDASY